MVDTALEHPIYPRIYKPAGQSFFLFGPRGVGKSTWAKRTFPEARRIDLLDESLYQSYLVDPEAFAAELRALFPGAQVVVDEIQRIPGLLNQVHRFITRTSPGCARSMTFPAWCAGSWSIAAIVT